MNHPTRDLGRKVQEAKEETGKMLETREMRLKLQVCFFILPFSYLLTIYEYANFISQPTL